MVCLPHMMLLSTVLSDGLSNYRKGWIPHLDQLPMTVQCHVYQDREVVHPAWWTQPYPDWRIQVEGRVAGAQVHWEGLKPQAPSTWLLPPAVNSSRSPGRLGKIGSMARKGPTIQNGTSCCVIESIKGPAWLCGMTRSGNNSGPKCMPLRMRRHPPAVNFLSAGSQLGTDNSLLTTMLLATMAKPWFKGSRGVILEGSSVFLYSCGICNTIWRVHGKSHMPTIVPYKHHVCPVLW